MVKWIVQCVAAGATLLAVIAAAVSYFETPPEQRAALWHGVGQVLVWVGIVAVLPWATFFVTTMAARRESNAAGSLLVAGYSLVDVAVLVALLGTPNSGFGICAGVFGVLLATTYNLLTCDWIAERGV